MDYGKRLKQLREEKNLSQKELTERLLLNRSTYARYETSSTQPDYSTLFKLADFYDVSIDYLLGRSNIRNTEDLAAHRSDNVLEDLPDEAMREVENFKDFIRSKYGKVNKKGNA